MYQQFPLKAPLNHILSNLSADHIPMNLNDRVIFGDTSPTVLIATFRKWLS
jgi:hypothetical protein